MTSQNAGWYPDPSGNLSQLRYWDGYQWTNDFINAQAALPQTQPIQPQAQSQVVVRETRYSSDAGYQTRVDQVYIQPTFQSGSASGQSLRLAAFIFNLISAIILGMAIIPLAWTIPMTVHSWRIYKGTARNSIAFGVCTLLFLNLAGGILLLISGEDR